LKPIGLTRARRGLLANNNNSAGCLASLAKDKSTVNDLNKNKND
jgi:hypothetical protein